MSGLAAASTLAAFADVLDDAQRSATPVEQLSARGELGLANAYAVQHAILARRQGRGERIAGVKLGFTSLAKARQMGVDDVIIGTITDAMRVDDGGRFDRRACIHPRIEPEVAYLLGADLDDTDLDDPHLDDTNLSDERALAAVIAGVAPALEIIDSRYLDFRFSLDDVVADNTSAAAFVIGPWVDPALAADLGNRGVGLEVNGHLVETGSTAAVLGHPHRAIAAARRLASAHGFALRAGMILLAGAATAAVPLPRRGFVEASIAGLGRVAVHVDGGNDQEDERDV
ncbi:fumarylacetoacetate hydrolase family protein [Leifsonia sp. Root4]|uniref:2-keto-4-pentenoate hydratase n=1 Tax=Leifsonia sp. Root4 TaxID=1736525 RepID=UPI000A47C177|nr:fumarylacetoacetate hydrolase family protein [Leifsonia sp. Root4]